MRKPFVMMAVLALALSLSATGLCEEKKEPAQPERYGHGWQHGGPMGYGSAPGHEMDYGYGMGPDYSAPGPLYSLDPEERKEWEKMWAHYLMETMEIRKQIAIKRIELETFWAQPNLDRAKVEKLSEELSELYAQRGKACDNYVLKAREAFGKLGWTCPIGRW